MARAIVVGQLVSTDAGRQPLLPPLHARRRRDPNTVDLTPGATTGRPLRRDDRDGSTVFFTTRDPLAPPSDQDTDSSADIFRADVSAGRRDSDPGLDRCGGSRQHRFLRPGCEHPQRELERRRRRSGRLQRRGDRRRRRRRVGLGAIYFLSPELARRRRERHAGRAQPLRRQSPARRRISSRRSSRTLTAAGSADRIPPLHHSFGSVPNLQLRSPLTHPAGPPTATSTSRTTARMWSASTTPPET